MKCAIIFGGVLRRYVDNYEHFLKAFDGIDIDIYASINKHVLQSAIEFSSLYNVKKIQINHLDLHALGDAYDFIDKTKGWGNYNTVSMFYHNKMAFDIVKKSGTSYDFVIKYRSDCIVNDGQIPISEFESGFIYIPEGNDWNGINDQIAIGDMDTMSKYCSLFDNIIKYIKADQCTFHPETILAHHLKKEKIEIKRFKFSYYLDPLRQS